MSEKRLAIAFAIGAFVLAGAALVVAIVRHSPEPAPVATPRVGKRPPTIKRLDKTHTVMSKIALDDLIAQRDQLDVTMHGATIVAFPGDSPLAKAGFEQGDTIRGVNGMNVATPADALGIYTQLKSAMRLTIDLERRGEPMQLTIDLY